MTGLIRNPTVTDAASRVSIFPAIRAWMVRLQQQLGAEGGVVMEGRDIGTVVFPHAEVKIFLDAAPEVRGQRRYEQMGQTGTQRPCRRRKRLSANCTPATNAIATAPIRRSNRRRMPSFSTRQTDARPGCFRSCENCGRQAAFRGPFLLTFRGIRSAGNALTARSISAPLRGTHPLQRVFLVSVSIVDQI